MVSYITTDIPLFSEAAVAAAPKLGVYDSLDEEVIKSYMEFSMASLIFFCMKESACSEQSSRMTAMDNASKNAGTVTIVLVDYMYSLRRFARIILCIYIIYLAVVWLWIIFIPLEHFLLRYSNLDIMSFVK